MKKNEEIPVLDKPVLSFESPKAWEAWLIDHHQESDGIWMRIYKKTSKVPTVVYGEALDVALCYGWIDSQIKKYDELSYVQKFTPRRKRSVWSQVNCKKVEAFIAAGKMQAAGLKEIEAAKADGRWDAAYASFSTATVPNDLQILLDQNPAAKRFFDTLSKTKRYQFITRIELAKRPETRQKRLVITLEKLLKGESL